MFRIKRPSVSKHVQKEVETNNIEHIQIWYAVSYKTESRYKIYLFKDETQAKNIYFENIGKEEIALFEYSAAKLMNKLVPLDKSPQLGLVRCGLKPLKKI